MPAETKTYPELLRDWIRRVVTYTDRLRYFGQNSVGYAFGRADAQQGAVSQSLYRALLRRFTIVGASGEDLVELLEENGTRQLGAQRSRVLIVLRPYVATVTNITAGLIEVDDSTYFQAGASLRIRSADGSTTEILTVDAVTSGTGPNGGDELDVGALTNVYSPATEDVKVLRRATIAEGETLGSDNGIQFETLEDVTVGDLNPVLDGESLALALADKVWAEATTKGEDGNIPFNNISGFTSSSPAIAEVTNPERAFGGADTETDFDAKYRATHVWTLPNQGTQAWLEALCKELNRDVLRVFLGTSSRISTVKGIVLTRNGGGLSTDAREALQEGVNQRMRSQLSCELVNMTLTAVEITAEVTLDPGNGTAADRLKAAWQRAADSYAGYLDYRKWTEGQAVDEAALLAILVRTTGISTVVTSTFSPSADVEVGTESLPVFTRLALTDTTSGQTYGADLQAEF